MNGVRMGSGELENVSITGFNTGLTVEPDAHARAKGLRLRGNRVGLDNHGHFDGPDTKF
jgi:hypothetical protein